MVNDPHGFTFRTGQIAGAANDNPGGHPNEILDILLRLVSDSRHCFLTLSNQGRTAFDIHNQGIKVAFTEYFELIERRQSFSLHQNRFDLTREDVDAANDQHVVSASSDSLHTNVSAATATGRRIEGGYIAGAIANDREGFLGQGGNDDFAGFAIGNWLTGVHVHRFDQEVIFKDVQTMLGLDALDANAGADDFRQAININGVNAEPRFQLITHLLGPRFCAENANLERQLPQIHIHVFSGFGQVQRVGRGAG